MKKLAFWGMLVLLCVFVPVSEGAVFNVSTPTEFQNALTQAETNGEDDVINVLADMTVTSTLTYTGEQGRTLTINGNGHSLDGGGTVQIMRIYTTGLADDTGSDITIQNLTFQNGSTGGSGGGLLVWTNAANITLENNSFSSNTAGSDGGGAFVGTNSGTATLTNNIFSSNTVSMDGGGVFVWTILGIATLTNNTFYGNSAGSVAGGFGGRLEEDTATLQVYNNIIWGNTASAGGNDGDDLYVGSDGDGNGRGSTVELYNNDLGPNAVFDEASDANPGTGSNLPCFFKSLHI